MHQIKGKKYITLREAAEKSGYSADYIGQLIRGGKLPGKKIYTNVAWVTTEDDVQQYLTKRRAGEQGGTHTLSLYEKLLQRFRRYKANMSDGWYTEIFVKGALYASICFSIVSLLVLFYVFSVTFDQKMQERTIESVSIGASDHNE